MLSPEPMRYLALVVLSADLEATVRAIAKVGVLHLLDVRQLTEHGSAVQPYNVRDDLQRLDELARSLDATARFLRLEMTPAIATDIPADIDLQLIERRAQTILDRIEDLRQQFTRNQEDSEQLQNLLRTLRVLEPLGCPLDELRRLRYVHLATGLLPTRNLPRLRDSLSSIAAVLLPAPHGGSGERTLLSALCLQRDREVLDRALRSASFEPLTIPAKFAGTPEEGIAQVARQLEAQQTATAALDAQRDAVRAELGPELEALQALITREHLVAAARGMMGHSERSTLISGWVPAILVTALEKVVRNATGERCVIQWRAPEALEDVQHGRIPVPILLHNPVLIRPFERLLRTYGLPRYGEIEPTPVVALGFLTMFGFMFGDVGHGAVLFAIGYFIYRRMFRYRDYAVILMECGVFAAIFGVLYGSVFGIEHWLPALWLRPLQDMNRLIQTAILFGIGFLSLGLILNVINVIRRRELAALWERNGLLAAFAYWIAVGLFLRRITAGPGAITAGTAALILAVPLALLFLKEPVRIIWTAVHDHQWPSPSEIFAVLVQSVVEVLDTVVSTISNTATFIRLAAFALSHAALFIAIFSIADAVTHAGGGSVGAAIVLVLGNAIIIALEGLIVSIQSVRLEYYEFFSKFYSAGGEEYRPLRLTPSAAQP